MKDIIRKLQIRENQVGRIINLPAMLNERFRNWPVELLSNKRTNLDYVVVFVENKKGVYAESCGLILAFLGNGGRNAATIFSLRYSSSR